MGFRDDILTLESQILQRKNHINNEETTKHSLIIPFIQLLGYDIFNPLEVRPEYTADFGKKKGEKVDYAVFKNDRPIILIEAKSITENLQNHDAQLSRYFNATPDVKLAILTNGIKYKFFTDLNACNIMDSTPFFEFDMGALNDDSISIIQKFTSSVFDLGQVVSFAEELAHISNLNRSLKDLFQNPSDDFIRLMIKDLVHIKLTEKVIERFRPIVKKAIKDTLIEIVSERLFQLDTATMPNTNISEIESLQTIKSSKIITTDEEIESFEFIKKILISSGTDISEVAYKDTTSYFGIYHKNINRWFVRINLDSSQKTLITRLPVNVIESIYPTFKVEPAPKGLGESRIFINSHHDINILNRIIIKCFEHLDEN